MVIIAGDHLDLGSLVDIRAQMVVVRKYIDLLIINEAAGDGSYKVTWWFGRNLRGVQTGRIQQYLMFALVVFMLVGAVLYFYFRYFRVLA